MKIQKLWVCLHFLLLAVTAAFFYKELDDAVPDQICCVRGEKIKTDYQVPVKFCETGQSREVAGSFVPEQNYELECRFLGIFPLKTVEVSVIEKQEVFAGGETVGIYVKTNGVLAIGTDFVETVEGIKESPCENLIRKGDYVLAVNGESISGKEQFMEAVDQSEGEKLILTVLREEEAVELAVKPAKVSEDEYRIGLWIRDDMAGVGTLTYTTADGKFAALGHGVNDADTGSSIFMEKGELYRTNIIGIIKGESGTPGEMTGMINYTPDYRIGTISRNTSAGIFGVIDTGLFQEEERERYEVGYKQNMKEGQAFLISNISGEMRQYEISVTKINYNSKEEHKSILFEVQDQDLIDLTGGIIQGMSGCPIIQNGKLIGAVTHVFVSDPRQGYGIFLEDMMENNT